jgi:sugar fermentation stimulation protein A
MKAWEKSLEMGLVPWLQSCRILKRNARLGDSLIDYLLECQGQLVFLEAKSAVLRESDYAMYPDCPSARGRRHIRELTNHVRQGGRAIIMFIAALPDVRAFRPNRLADPELCGLLVEAQRAGVTLKSVGMAYCPEGAYIYLFSPDLKVELS